jgi:FkbM family methyltransferase
MLNPNHSGANTVCSDVSLCKKYWSNSVEHVTVNAVSFDKIIQKYNIKSVDLLKIDCEGAEYEILYESNSLKEHIIKNIVGEFHGLEYTTVSKDPKNTKENLTRYIRNYISGIIHIT